MTGYRGGRSLSPGKALREHRVDLTVRLWDLRSWVEESESPHRHTNRVNPRLHPRLKPSQRRDDSSARWELLAPRRPHWMRTPPPSNAGLPPWHPPATTQRPTCGLGAGWVPQHTLEVTTANRVHRFTRDGVTLDSEKDTRCGSGPAHRPLSPAPHRHDADRIPRVFKHHQLAAGGAARIGRSALGRSADAPAAR